MKKTYVSLTADVIRLAGADLITMSVAGDYVGDELPDGVIHLFPWDVQ